MGSSATGARHKPAQTCHRSGGYTSLGEFAGEEEVLSKRVVPQRVEGEVSQSIGAITNLCLKASSSRATANLRTSVVVGSHRTAFAVEVLGVDGNLAISARSDFGIQHLILGKHEFVNGVVAFRNFGEGQGVVVMQSGVVSRSRPFHEGERGGFLAGKLPNIRHGGIVRFSHDVPNAGRAAGAVDGHHLPSRIGRAASAQSNTHFFVVSHCERHFGLHNSEVFLRREVQMGHRDGGTIITQAEAERLHPAAIRAGADDDGLDNLTVLKSIELVASATATTSRDVNLDVGTVGRDVLVAAVRTQVVRIWIGTVAVIGQNLVRSGGVIEVTRAVARGVLVHTDHQVADSVVLERSVKRDGRPTIVESHGATKHHV